MPNIRRVGGQMVTYSHDIILSALSKNTRTTVTCNNMGDSKYVEEKKGVFQRLQYDTPFKK